MSMRKTSYTVMGVIIVLIAAVLGFLWLKSPTTDEAVPPDTPVSSPPYEGTGEPRRKIQSKSRL